MCVVWKRTVRMSAIRASRVFRAYRFQARTHYRRLSRISEVFPGDEVTAEQSQRISELSKMSKARLLEIIRDHAKRHGARWIIGGPQLWSKDELIDGIMEFERKEPAKC